MNILKHFGSGASRSLKSWKWILIIWSVTLFLVSLLALTVRGELNGIFGSSMITEKLVNGFNLDAIANAGTRLNIFASSFRTGFFLVVLFGLLINVFFNGGLFSVLRKAEGKQTSAGFFSGASSNFWSFLVISLLVSVMIIFLSLLLIGLPVSMMMGSDSGGSSILLKISSVILLLILPLFLLVADYARAWQASTEKKNAFIAIGQGFKNTFASFFSSWLMMFTVVLIQTLFTLLVLKVTADLKPVSSAGIFLLFILIQILFIIRIFLRSLRYGTISSKFEEQNSGQVQ